MAHCSQAWTTDQATASIALHLGVIPLGSGVPRAVSIRSFGRGLTPTGVGPPAHAQTTSSQVTGRDPQADRGRRNPTTGRRFVDGCVILPDRPDSAGEPPTGQDAEVEDPADAFLFRRR